MVTSWSERPPAVGPAFPERERATRPATELGSTVGPMELDKGTVAVVTGGGSGIGLALGDALARTAATW